MKITRVIALSIVAGTFGMSSAQAQSQAQSLGQAGPPAEFPPASYQGKQYVDSQGCVFIRAGVDGNVTWVPRVSRSRKQLCGYQPTVVAGTTRSAPQSDPAPQLITLPANQQPAAPAATALTDTTPTPSVTSSKAPRAPAPTKPQRPATTAARSAPPVKPASQPVAVVPAAPRATTLAEQRLNDCSNVSALGQQYSNNGARCGPQAESPVTYGSGVGAKSSLRLTPNTRVVPTHVYQARRHSQGLTVPAGYRAVWQDDRLNLHRAERGLKPAVVAAVTDVPAGFVLANREDDRLSTQRAMRTAAGDAQSDLIWSRTVPRKLVARPLDRSVVTLSSRAARSQAEAHQNMVLRLSTRSAPGAEQVIAAPKSRRYVRAATFADPAAARIAAQGLAASGLPVRLGSLTRKGKVYKVVLSGPFNTDSAANAALSQVRAAGYSGARLSK